MPILTPVSRITLTVVCDVCQHRVLAIEESLYQGVDRLRQQGWTFRYPDAACPACKLPPRPSGQAYVDRG